MENICSKHGKPILKRYNSTIGLGCVLCIIKKETSKSISSKEKLAGIEEKRAINRDKAIKKIGAKPKMKKADDQFSLFIRQRDADENGIIRCISCGKPRHWKKADCGHYLKRQHMATRFDEVNCNSQCKPCNSFEQGNNVNYRIGLIKKYGLEVVELLEIRQNNTCHMNQFEFDLIENIYRVKNQQFKN